MTNKILSRRGSTMVEIIVALALVSIVSIMIVSFTAMTSNFAEDEQSKHDFVDSCAAIRRDINDYLLTCDIDEAEVNVAQLNDLWDNETKELKGRKLKGVDEISFAKVSDKLVKCTVSCDDGTGCTQIFVFALRCATFQ